MPKQTFNGSGPRSKLKPRFLLVAARNIPVANPPFKLVKNMMPFNCEQKRGRAIMGLGGPLRIMGLTRILILFCALLHHPAHAFNASLPDTYSLNLSWGDSSPSPGVTGYRVYYGTESGNYTNSVVAGNVTTATISGLSNGVDFYFAITAFDEDGLESDFSNESSYRQELSGARMQIHSVSDGQFMLTVTGPPGNTYYVLATETFENWTVIGTVTLDDSGLADFTDPDAASFPQRFYRTFWWE